MNKLILALATTMALASAPAMAQTNGLFKPTSTPQTAPAAQPKAAAQPKSAAQAMMTTATDSGGALAPAAGGSQIMPVDARVRTVAMRNYETCKYTLNKVQAKLAGAQTRETTAGLVITRRDNVATYVSTCAPDGTMSTAAYTGGRVPPVTIPGGGGSTRPGTPGVVTQER
jgi:hypothetical protein